MTDLEQRVIGFVAEQTGIRADRIGLSSRLDQDLGIVGDDAVEFVEQYAKRFGVEVADLEARWDDYFTPETTAANPGCLVAIGLGMIAGNLLHSFVPAIPVWAATLGVAWLLSWGYARFFCEPAPERLPIRVVELAEAAERGYW